MASLDSPPRALVGPALAVGGAQIAAGVLMYLAGVYFRPWSSAISLAVLLAGIVWAIRREPGAPSYRRALAVGVAVSASTAVLYAAYSLVSIRFVYEHFLAQMVELRLATARLQGRPDAEMAAIAANTTAGWVAIGNLLRLAIAGSILSLPAALARRRRAASGPA